MLRVPASAVDQVVDELRLTSGSVSASPVVSVEPRVRKFHQPVTVTIPLPPHSRHRLDNASSLHLLCSMSGTIQYNTIQYYFILLKKLSGRSLTRIKLHVLVTSDQ